MACTHSAAQSAPSTSSLSSSTPPSSWTMTNVLRGQNGTRWNEDGGTTTMMHLTPPTPQGVWARPDRPTSNLSTASSSRSASALDGFYTPNYISASGYRPPAPSSPSSSSSSPSTSRPSSKVSAAYRQAESPSALPVRTPIQEQHEFPVDVEDEEDELLVLDDIIRPSERKALPPLPSSPTSDQSDSANGIAGQTDGQQSASDLQPRVLAPSDSIFDISVGSGAVDNAWRIEPETGGGIKGQRDKAFSGQTERVEMQGPTRPNTSVSDAAPIRSLSREDIRSAAVTDSLHQGGAISSAATESGQRTLSNALQYESAQSGDQRQHRRVRSALSNLSSTQSPAPLLQRQSVPSSHSRSISTSTAVSSMASESGESGLYAGVIEQGKAKRFRSLSDNFRRLSLFKRTSEDQPSSERRTQNEESEQKFISSWYTTSDQVSQPSVGLRPSHLTLDALSRNASRPQSSVMSRDVESEILQPHDASALKTSSQQMQGLVDWGIEPQMNQSFSVDSVSGWNRAKPRADSEKTFKTTSPPVALVSRFPMLGTLDDTGNGRQAEAQQERGLPAGRSHSSQSFRESGRSTPMSAQSGSQSAILVPSNFNSNPAPRSGSSLSAYARRRSSNSSSSKARQSITPWDPDDVQLVGRDSNARSMSTDHSALGDWKGLSSHGPQPPLRRPRAGSVNSAPHTSVAASPTPMLSSKAATGYRGASSAVEGPSSVIVDIEPATAQPAKATSPTFGHQPVSPRSFGTWTEYNAGTTGEVPFPVRTATTSPDSRSERYAIANGPLSASSHNHTLSSQPSHASVGYSFVTDAVPRPDSQGTFALQISLDEEDMEIVDHEDVFVEEVDVYSIRRRLVIHFSDLGAKRASAGRPLAHRSRPTSGAAMDDDGGPLFGDEIDRGENSASAKTVSSEKERKKRLEALENRERELMVEPICRTEMAFAYIDVWTESRKGKWVVRGPAADDAFPTERLPDDFDPWSVPIDAKGIVRRKKLKSNIELTSSRTVISCPSCRSAESANMERNCQTCQGSSRVEMAFVVQCTVRLAQFLPLKLPATFVGGTKQPHITYLDVADPDLRRQVLRDRALDGLQGSAGRVVRVHNAEHGSQLLMGRATIKQKGLTTVVVRSSKSKAVRVFDVEDGVDGRIEEVTSTATNANTSPRGAGPGLAPPPEAFDGGSSRRSISSLRRASAGTNQSNSGILYSLSNHSAQFKKKKANKGKGFNGNASSPNLVPSSSTMKDFHDPTTHFPLPLPPSPGRLAPHAQRDGQSEEDEAGRAQAQSSMSKRSIKSIFRSKER